MKRSLFVGRVDYLNCGRKENDVVLNVEVSKGSNPKFTVDVDVWNRLGTDILMGGQCIDEALDMIPELPTSARTVREWWSKYHFKEIFSIPKDDLTNILSFLNRV